MISLWAKEEPIPAYLQDISVTIRSGSAEGSGVIFSRRDSSSNLVDFVWTAGHVVADLRREREVVSADGSKKTLVEFSDPRVVKEIREDGRTVGRLEIDAEVIKYSDADNGEDLAILRLRKHNFTIASTRFYLDPEVPALGTDLYHVGSLLGQQGANSMTSGIYSQYGRIINKIIFDQTTCAAFPGSSGGGVFLRDGRYVGMLVRGAGETFNLIIPVRRIVLWTTRTKTRWAIDPKTPMPSEDEIRRIPVEDIGHVFVVEKSKNAPAETKFMIRNLNDP